MDLGSWVQNRKPDRGLWNPAVRWSANNVGAAGTVGLASGATGTFPGSRWGASAWVDQGGNFWLFGGWGLDSTATNGNGALNDLWVYTPNATATQPGTWTWIKGSNTGSQNGSYGDADASLRDLLHLDTWRAAVTRRPLSTALASCGSSAVRATIPRVQPGTATSTTCGDTCLTITDSRN